MYRGKRVKHGMWRGKSAALVASLVLILGVAVSGVVAFLVDSAGPVENTFLPSKVPPHIVEEFDGTTKSDVQIKNDGDVNAYIRAAVVTNWVKKNDQGGYDVYGVAPKWNVDYVWYPSNDSAQAGYNNTDWIQGADGYYYCKSVIEAKEETAILFTKCAPVAGKAPEGYTLSVEILAQTIQADGQDSTGKKPVLIAWGAGNGGSVTGVDSNGTLTVTPAAN